MSSLFLLHGLLYHISYSLLGSILTTPSQFEAGSSSAIVPNLVGEATAFFTRFDLPEVNELDLANF